MIDIKFDQSWTIWSKPRSVPRPGNAQVKGKVLYEVYEHKKQWQGWTDQMIELSFSTECFTLR